MALTEAEELELLELENEEALLRDAPSQPRQAADYGEALLTNLPTSGFRQDVVRGLPATVGAIPGAAAGAAIGTGIFPGPGTVVGGILGAGIGGLAGESVRQAASQGTAAAFPEQGYPIARPKEVLRDIGIQGAFAAGGEGLGLATGSALRAMRPGANRLGAQFMRVTSGVPEKAGEAAMRTPGVLLDAPTVEGAAAGYQAFERYTGLKGLGELVKESGRFPSETQLEEMVFGTAKKAAEGTATQQEMYLASQAASNLQKMAKLGNPRYATLEWAITTAKASIDKVLETALPEHGSLRSGYFGSKVREEFLSLFPLNKNTSPNVLRAVTAAGTAAAGTIAGRPEAAVVLPLVSPLFYGTALKGAALAGKIPAGVYRMVTRAAIGGAGSVAQEYMRLRQQP